MTTEELINKLSERVTVAQFKKSGDIKKLMIIDNRGNAILRIPVAATNWLELEFVGDQLVANPFDKSVREYISTQISKYLNTPLEKRELKKKYRLRWMDDENGHANYMSFEDDGAWYLSPRESARLYTNKELGELKQTYPGLISAIEAMKVEAKSDED